MKGVGPNSEPISCLYIAKSRTLRQGRKAPKIQCEDFRRELSLEVFFVVVENNLTTKYSMFSSSMIKETKLASPKVALRINRFGSFFTGSFFALRMLGCKKIMFSEEAMSHLDFDGT